MDLNLSHIFAGDQEIRRLMFFKAGPLGSTIPLEDMAV